MLRNVSVFALSTACFIGLSACSTTPPASTLMTGISTADAAKVFPDGQLRAASDPVCVSFYNNARTYVTEASKPHAGNKFLTSLGVSVLSSIALGGIATSGIDSQVGQIVANQTANTAIRQGSNIALAGIKKDSAGGAQIVAAAQELNCPVDLA